MPAKKRDTWIEGSHAFWPALYVVKMIHLPTLILAKSFCLRKAFIFIHV